MAEREQARKGHIWKSSSLGCHDCDFPVWSSGKQKPAEVMPPGLTAESHLVKGITTFPAHHWQGAAHWQGSNAQHFVGRKALVPGREAPFSCSLPPVPSPDKAWHCSPGKRNIYLIQLQYLQAGHRWLQLGLRDNKWVTETGGEVKVGLKRGESKGWSGWVAGKVG